MATSVQYAQLYRVLRDGEDVSNGIHAENPLANRTIVDHVTNGSYYASQYISTSASPTAAEAFARKGKYYTPGSRRIAIINTLKIPAGTVVYTDLTNPYVLYTNIPYDERAQNFARKFEEVIIKGYILADCIDGTYVV